MQYPNNAPSPRVFQLSLTPLQTPFNWYAFDKTNLWASVCQLWSFTYFNPWDVFCMLLFYFVVCDDVVDFSLIQHMEWYLLMLGGHSWLCRGNHGVWGINKTWSYHIQHMCPRPLVSECSFYYPCLFPPFVQAPQYEQGIYPPILCRKTQLRCSVIRNQQFLPHWRQNNLDLWTTSPQHPPMNQCWEREAKKRQQWTQVHMFSLFSFCFHSGWDLNSCFVFEAGYSR